MHGTFEIDTKFHSFIYITF